MSMRLVFAILGHTSFPGVDELIPPPYCVGWDSGENPTARPPTREAVIAVLIACS